MKYTFSAVQREKSYNKNAKFSVMNIGPIKIVINADGFGKEHLLKL